MFAEELSNLVVDEEYREEHGSACRTRARGNFDLNETAKEYRDIYLQVISETSEGRETRAV
jgi:glycosyltransferase involved in cell wall biosynthesis